MAHKSWINYASFDVEWMEDSRCRREGVPADRFFSDTARDVAGRMVMREMQEFCAGCEVRSECLAYALASGEEGIWGGTTTRDREYMSRTGRVPPAGRR